MSGPIAVEPRASWEPDLPLSWNALNTPVPYVFCALHTSTLPCHNTEDCQSTIREMQYEQMYYEKLQDIRYNFVIGGDGKIYECRGWHNTPELPEKYSQLNNKSLFIAFIGDPHVEPVSEKMLEARDSLLTQFIRTYHVRSKFNHILLKYKLRTFEEAMEEKIRKEHEQLMKSQGEKS